MNENDKEKNTKEVEDGKKAWEERLQCMINEPLKTFPVSEERLEELRRKGKI